MNMFQKHERQSLLIVLTLCCLSIMCLAFAENPIMENPGQACWLQDERGRNFLPHGFVTVTEDQIGPIRYTAGDYQRMLRCGANCQVIRLSLAELGGWPGYDLREDYLKQLDSMVQLGRDAGLQTAFKMTVYGIKRFGAQGGWDKLLTLREHQAGLIEAWKIVWTRYQDESSVFGYDLLNEPFRGSLDASYEEVTNERLIPLYRGIIDELRKIGPDKWAIYQPLLMDIADRGLGKLPMAPMNISLNRKRLIFAPHGYFSNVDLHKTAVERHLREAKFSGARLMMGEWGRQTYAFHDTSFEEQLKYQLLYAELANLFDTHHMGTIKPWFTGTRSWNKGAQSAIGFTWSVFSDPTATGSVERKYILDIVARPFPLIIAGHVTRFGFNFASRILTVELVPDRDVGSSEIFIGADRHYPDGFTVLCNNDVVFVHGPDARTPDMKTTDLFHFDPKKQRLKITRWPGSAKQVTLKIRPGTLRIR